MFHNKNENKEMSRIFLIEDHDEALRIWRENKIKSVDLVHIDAHIDFGFHPAKSIKRIFVEAGSLKELKKGLESSLSFMRYEKNFDKQTNIGNYIYPAIQEGIVKDFYWVIPGGLKEFSMSLKNIKNMLKNFSSQDSYKADYSSQASRRGLKKGIISADILGRKFVVCVLEKLPALKQNTLLDIDTDFLIIDSLINANNTSRVGKREPWILPRDLVEILKKKVKKPYLTTIAYSVNGGYTPMGYKHLGDEIAYRFAPEEFKQRYKINSQAAQYFNLFVSTGNKECYQKAVKLNSAYRAADNNYGPLYLLLRKFSHAQKEFAKVLRVDPDNPACLSGLGTVALQRKDFRKAREYFSSALSFTDDRLFIQTKEQALLDLAKAEFNLKNFDQAKQLLFRYQTLKPLIPESYYFLGRIFEKEKVFFKAANFYQDAIRLGFDNIEVLSRLLKVSCCMKERNNIIKFVTTKYKERKQRFLKTKRVSLKKNRKIKGLHRLQREMLSFERRLEKT